jgi:hypothetical protein
MHVVSDAEPHAELKWAATRACKELVQRLRELAEVDRDAALVAAWSWGDELRDEFFPHIPLSQEEVAAREKGKQTHWLLVWEY